MTMRLGQGSHVFEPVPDWRSCPRVGISRNARELQWIPKTTCTC